MGQKASPQGGIILSNRLIDVWKKSVIASGRLPRGTNPKELTEKEQFKLIAGGEKGAVAELWDIYNQERERLGRAVLNPKRQTVGYLLGFHLANMARFNILWKRLRQRIDIDLLKTIAKNGLVIHDLGCGTGAFSLALADILMREGLSKKTFNIELYDQVAAFLEAAEFGLKELIPEVKVNAHRQKLGDKAIPVKGNEEGWVNIYGLGYVWNELHRNPRAKQSLLASLNVPLEKNKPALIFVFEPGSETQSRDAMGLRDSLVEMGFIPLYPCPTAHLCPMLERPKDWCYSEGPWQVPEEQKKIDQFLRIDRKRIGGSMFVFATPDLAEEFSAPFDEMKIVVGRPVKTDKSGKKITVPKKGKAPARQPIEYLVCSQEGLSKTAPKEGEKRRERGEYL